MRVALFTETWLPKVNGVVSILRYMLEHMQSQEIDVLMFGPEGGPAEYAGAEIVGMSGPPFPFYPEVKMGLPNRKVGAVLRRFQPDLIHVVNPAFLGPTGIYYARRLNLPLVASYHTDVPGYTHRYGWGWSEGLLWWYFRTLHNVAHLNLCPSSVVLHQLRRQGFRRVRWWHRGIDTSHFTPEKADPAMRQRLTGGHPDEFLVVYVGRLAREKGLYDLREPLGNLPGVRVAFVGGGPQEADLKEFYAGTPTVFPGILRGDELVAAYAAADLFVFPSENETFGLVALEAMACGVPVIAPRVGGVLDIVTDNDNGIYYDPGKPEQIRGLVAALRDDPARRARLAGGALAHARSRDWRGTMDQLLDYYQLAIRVFNRAEPRHRRRPVPPMRQRLWRRTRRGAVGSP